MDRLSQDLLRMCLQHLDTERDHRSASVVCSRWGLLYRDPHGSAHLRGSPVGGKCRPPHLVPPRPLATVSLRDCLGVDRHGQVYSRPRDHQVRVVDVQSGRAGLIELPALPNRQLWISTTGPGVAYVDGSRVVPCHATTGLTVSPLSIRSSECLAGIVTSETGVCAVTLCRSKPCELEVNKWRPDGAETSWVTVRDPPRKWWVTDGADRLVVLSEPPGVSEDDLFYRDVTLTIYDLTKAQAQVCGPTQPPVLFQRTFEPRDYWYEDVERSALCGPFMVCWADFFCVVYDVYAPEPSPVMTRYNNVIGVRKGTACFDPRRDPVIVHVDVHPELGHILVTHRRSVELLAAGSAVALFYTCDYDAVSATMTMDGQRALVRCKTDNGEYSVADVPLARFVKCPGDTEY